MKCVKCGKDISDDSIFCNYCGFKQDADHHESLNVKVNEVYELDDIGLGKISGEDLLDIQSVSWIKELILEKEDVAVEEKPVHLEENGDSFECKDDKNLDTEIESQPLVIARDTDTVLSEFEDKLRNVRKIGLDLKVGYKYKRVADKKEVQQQVINSGIGIYPDYYLDNGYGCSPKQADLVYVESIGVFAIFNHACLIFLPDMSIKSKVLVSVSKEKGESLYGLNYYRNKIYYWVGDWNGFTLEEYDLYDGTKKRLKLPDELNIDLSETRFIIKGGIGYTVSKDNKLWLINMDTLGTRYKKLPKIQKKPIPMEWKKEIFNLTPIARANAGKGYVGFYIKDNFGYLTLKGLPKCSIRFKLATPQRVFEYLPLGCCCTMKNIGMIDVEGGIMFGNSGIGPIVSNSPLTNLKIVHTTLGAHKRSVYWWKSHGVFFIGDHMIDFNRGICESTVVDLDVLDFTEVLDGSVYIRTVNKIYHLPPKFEVKIKNTRDMEKYVVYTHK